MQPANRGETGAGQVRVLKNYCGAGLGLNKKPVSGSGRVSTDVGRVLYWPNLPHTQPVAIPRPAVGYCFKVAKRVAY